MAGAWVTMAFAAPLSATDARGMCAEHVLGVSLDWVFEKTRRRVVLENTTRSDSDK